MNMLRRFDEPKHLDESLPVFERPTIFLLDNNAKSRNEIESLFKHHSNWDILGFELPDDSFFEQLNRLPLCVLLDYDLPNLNGLEVHSRIIDLDLPTSTVFLSEGATVRLAVQIMESGATSLVEKPCNPKELIKKTNNAIRKSLMLRKDCTIRNNARARLSRLTIREQLLVVQLLSGKLNKQIAATMDISLRTVERRRQSIMNKTNCESVFELSKLVQESRYHHSAGNRFDPELSNQVV